MNSINPMQKRYKCSKCEVEFGYLSHAKDHINRKTTCKLDDSSIATIIHTPKTNCPYCAAVIKTATRINFMEEHIKICAHKPAIVEKEHTTINNVCINNVNINIQINSYESPSIDHIVYSRELMLDRPKIFKITFFDPLHIENHSIIFDKVSNKLYLYYNNEARNIKDKDDNKLKNTMSYIMDKVEDRILKHNFKDVKVYEAELEKLGYGYGEREEKNFPKYLSILDDYSDIPLQTRKLIEQ